MYDQHGHSPNARISALGAMIFTIRVFPAFHYYSQVLSLSGRFPGREKIFKVL